MTFGSVSAVCVAALALACGGSTTVTEITGPTGDAARCQTAISSSSQSLPAGGGSVTASVSAGRECTWSATSDASWVQVSPSNGQGEGSLTVTAAANPVGQSRSAAVVVNDQRLNLSQEPAPCQFQVGDTPRLSQGGGRATMSVSATDGCAWSATTNAAWVRVLTGSGSGSGTVQLEAAPNPGAARSATLSIAGHTRTLTQEGRSNPPGPDPDPDPPPPDPDPPPPSCSPSIDPGERSFDHRGGDGSFGVNVSSGCRWDANSDVPWIDIKRSSGNESATVNYTVAANANTDSRTGIITISGRTHTVRQQGAPRDDDDDDDDDDEDQIEISGRAFFVGGTCPQKGFLLDGQRTFTDGDTKFKGGNCDDIRNGTQLEVKGRRTQGWVRADEVRIRDDDD